MNPNMLQTHHLPHITRNQAVIIGLSVLVVMLLILNILERVEYSAELNRFSDEQRYLSDRINEEVTISDNERRMKVVSMYATICGKYGNKWHPNNNKGDNRKYQGLSKWQKAEFFLACFNYETVLGLPYFTLPTLAMIETAFNPIAATYWENGSLKEAGIFQHRREAVGQAYLYWKSLQQVNPGIADKLSFNYTQMEDLWDPINAAKIEAVLAWGLKREFKGELPFYISALHWGINRVMPYWQNNYCLPDKFVFNKGLDTEDVRNPLTYAIVFNELYASFSRFRIEVNIDYTYIERYKKRCSDVEWQFIDSWKYVKELKDKVKELEDFQIESKREHIEMLTKLKERVEKTDKEYERLMGVVQSGKFNNIQDVFRLWRDAFKLFINDIRTDETRRVSFIIQVVVIAVICLIIIPLIIILTLVLIEKKITKKKSDLRCSQNIEIPK